MVEIVSLYRSILALSCLLLSACTSIIDQRQLLHSQISSDRSYFEVLSKHTQKKDLVVGFSTIYSAEVTQLNSEFLNALQKRQQKLFAVASDTLSSNESEQGFFVSIYASKEDFRDLSNQDLWKLSLKDKTSNEVVSPSSIESLNNKAKWSGFFPGVNVWTKEYLIVFPSKNNQQLELNFYSTLGSLNFQW